MNGAPLHICGIACVDVAFIYVPDDRTPLRKTQSPADRKHIYVGIQHGLLDPVLKAATDDDLEFFTQSFLSNVAAYKVHLAAVSVGEKMRQRDPGLFFIGEREELDASGHRSLVGHAGRR